MPKAGGYTKAGQQAGQQQHAQHADDERNPMVSMPVAASESDPGGASSERRPTRSGRWRVLAGAAAIVAGASGVFALGLLAGRLSSPSGAGLLTQGVPGYPFRPLGTHPVEDPR
jgi:hypothetical protein